MIVAYAGGHYFFVYPKGEVITFLYIPKGGHQGGVMCFCGVFCW